MSNRDSNFMFHSILEVEALETFIAPEWEDVLSNIIANRMRDNGNRCLIVKGMPDHIHVLYKHSGNMENLLDLFNLIKDETSDWINSKLQGDRFLWKNFIPIFALDDFIGGQYYEKINRQRELHKQYAFYEEYKMIIEDSVLFDS